MSFSPLQVARAVTSHNGVAFFRLYRSAPNMGAHVIESLAEGMRMIVLQLLSQSSGALMCHLCDDVVQCAPVYQRGRFDTNDRLQLNRCVPFMAAKAWGRHNDTRGAFLISTPSGIAFSQPSTTLNQQDDFRRLDTAVSSSTGNEFSTFATPNQRRGGLNRGHEGHSAFTSIAR